MAAKMSELEARLVSRKALRAEAARAELAKSTTPSLASLAWVAPWLVAAIFGDRLAHYYGISSQLFFLLCMVFGSLFFFVAQTFALQRKVNALTEIVQAQVDRETAA